MKESRSAALRAWRAPGWLALATAAGLLAGLLGDGGWDGAAACAVGSPLCVALWCLGHGRRALPPSPVPRRSRPVLEHRPPGAPPGTE